MDYTLDKYYKYNGKKWSMLQNGENIVIAKRSSLLRLTEDEYTLLTSKEVSFDTSDIDIIFLKK